MIKFVEGNFFDYPAKIRINTVNCVGVMGAGVALQFKNKYPLMFEDYEAQCRLKLLRPGKPHIWRNNEMFAEDITIINFPTKDHWKSPSKYEYIEDGLLWLRDYLLSRPGLTITVPALGCGHGGLDWSRVKPMIESYLGGVNADILVFEPASSKSSSISKDQLQELQEADVKSIAIQEIGLAIKDSSDSAKQVYIRGAIPAASQGFLSILLSGKGTDRERSAVFQFLDAMAGCGVPLLLNYNTTFELSVIKHALDLHYKVVVVVPFGILKVKEKKDLQAVWSNREVAFISLTAPYQEWKSYEGINALKFRISHSSVILFATENLTGLEKFEKEIIQSRAKKFYLKFWQETVSFFNLIHATQIGKDPTYHRPNVQPILSYMDSNCSF